MFKPVTRLLGLLSACVSMHCWAVEIPKSLEEWKPWVLEKHGELNCPVQFNSDARHCIWPSQLTINANRKGAIFSQRIDVFQADWIKLPGNTSFWPQNVKDNAATIVLRDKDGWPEVYLTTGSHLLSGEIRWNEMPRVLPIPEQSGIVQLTLNDKTLIAPEIQNNNQLWLSASEKQTAAAHQDTFDLHVFRKIDDTIPIKVTTQLQLEVSGKERELQLGQLLLDGFNAIEFNSELPARLEKDGSLRIQVKPGSWELTLVSQSLKPQKELTFKATSDLWPQEEIWVFAAQRQLRSVQISGAPTVDPQQTQLPDEWKSLPAYLVTPTSHFKIEELQRGEAKNTANELALSRNAWLSFDGKVFILKDDISGHTQNSRIETTQPVELTSASIQQKPQMITLLANNKNTGIEIRSRDIDINAVSQLPRNLSTPVSGWHEEFKSVSTQLHLPPGWSLLTATGTSSESGSWLSGWTLWDMFLVLIIVVAITRLTNPTYGLLAAITLMLIYQRTGAPVYVWLNLTIAIALTAFVSGKFKNFMIRYTYMSILLLALALLPFSVHQARAIINLQLGNEAIDTILPSSFVLMPADSKKKPAAAPAPMQDEVNAEDIGSFPDQSLAEPLQRVSGVSASKLTASKPISRKYDPNQQTQTGVAVPTWYANSVYLYWNGPIKAEETTQLILIPPLLNRLGYLLCVILPLLLAGVLIRHFLQFIPKNNSRLEIDKKISAQIASCILLTCLLGFPTDAVKADGNINPDILKELETRLTEAPHCLPNCAAIESVNVDLKQDELTLDLVVHANDFIALPLPADHEQWWPNNVTVDGKSALLVQTNDQRLLVSLPKGRHSLSIKANLPGRDAFNIEFPLQLHNVESKINGWEMSGIPTVEQTSQSLQLQRVERDENLNKAERLRPDPIAPFVIVRRELTLDLEWTLTTTVKRVAPAFGAINMEIPIIDGEAPLSAQLNTNGKINVHLEANQQEFQWVSNVKQTTPLQLQAAQNVPWIEIWSLNAGALWHIESSGLSPVQMGKHEHLPLWQPWPGETLQLSITRPQAAKGSYVTIDSSTLSFALGERSNITKLALDVRTNQGGQYNFTLPSNAKLASVEIDNQPLTISTTHNQLKIPLHPGKQKILLAWNSDQGVTFFTKTPEFTLDQGSSNQQISVSALGDRWIFMLGGPLMGPSILIWGMLLVIVLAGLALGKTKITPLKSYEWIILGLGICTQSFFTFIVVAAWLIALQKRGQLTDINSRWQFKFLQLCLFLFSIIALSFLLATIPEGLLGSPDMRITGNNSNNGYLNWYQDHSDSTFPTAWFISLPGWCYKIVILVWSLWLASSLVTWIRWGWLQLSQHGLWYADENIISNAVIRKTDQTATESQPTN